MHIVFWDAIQLVLGAPKFKRELYRSVLGSGSSRLLDFGCADGHIADSFSEPGVDYYGIDLDPKSIAFAQKTYAGRKNMRFICADLKSRPFEKDFFDQVLFAGTAHHLTDALYAEMLSELHFCLKPGGIIHILDPVLQSKDGWQERLLRRVDRGRYPRTTERLIGLVPPGLFQIGAATHHTPYGALMQDCDFIHFSLTKRA